MNKLDLWFENENEDIDCGESLTPSASKIIKKITVFHLEKTL